MALRFGQEGAMVVAAKRLVLCEQTVSQIRKKGGETFAIQTDVAYEQKIECGRLRSLSRYWDLQYLETRHYGTHKVIGE